MNRFKENLDWLCVIFIMSFIFVPIFVSGYFVDENRAIQTSQTFGFSNSKIVKEHRIFSSLTGCDKHDSAGFTINAMNSKGENVNLLVCCGLIFKSCTIRY